MDQGRAPVARHPSRHVLITRTHPATTDEQATDRLVNPVPLPPKCPAGPAGVKGCLWPSRAIEQARPLTRAALTRVWRLAGGRGKCGHGPAGGLAESDACWSTP